MSTTQERLEMVEEPAGEGTLSAEPDFHIAVEYQLDIKVWKLSAAGLIGTHEAEGTLEISGYIKSLESAPLNPTALTRPVLTLDDGRRLNISFAGSQVNDGFRISSNEPLQDAEP